MSRAAGTVTDNVTGEWRPVPDWPYEASSDGRVRRSRGGCGAVVGRILKPWWAGGREFGNTRYEYVELCRDGERWKVAVHVLVCLAFHGPKPDPDAVVDHIDDDPGNNCAANLEWVGRPENLARWMNGNGASTEALF